MDIPPNIPTTTSVSVAAAPRETPSILRRGFTLELGTGLAYTTISGKQIPPGNGPRWGAAPLSMSLGAFITGDISLLFRVTSIFWVSPEASISEPNAPEDTNLITTGVAAQYFLSDHFFLGAGVARGGLYFEKMATDGSTVTSPTRNGFFITARAGYAFIALDHNAFSVVAELTPGFFGTTTFVGNTLQLQWQYY